MSATENCPNCGHPVTCALMQVVLCPACGKKLMLKQRFTLFGYLPLVLACLAATAGAIAAVRFTEPVLGFAPMSDEWVAVLLAAIIVPGSGVFYGGLRLLDWLGLYTTKGESRLKIIDDLPKRTRVILWALIVLVIAGVAAMMVVVALR